MVHIQSSRDQHRSAIPVRAETSSASCDQAVFVDQATGVSVFLDAVLVEVDRFG
jgi:hypothetical protein